MPYQIAGIDVHKKMLAVAVADIEVGSDFHFERLKVGTSPVQLRALAEWLVEREVEEVVMESTAQYWRPVWEALERYWKPTRRTRPDANPLSGTLHLAQAQSNRGAGGRKKDFPDAERACTALHAVYRRLVKLTLEELRVRRGPPTCRGPWLGYPFRAADHHGRDVSIPKTSLAIPLLSSRGTSRRS